LSCADKEVDQSVEDQFCQNPSALQDNARVFDSLQHEVSHFTQARPKIKGLLIANVSDEEFFLGCGHISIWFIMQLILRTTSGR